MIACCPLIINPFGYGIVNHNDIVKYLFVWGIVQRAVLYIGNSGHSPIIYYNPLVVPFALLCPTILFSPYLSSRFQRWNDASLT